MKKQIITSFLALGIGITAQAFPSVETSLTQSAVKAQCPPKPNGDDGNAPVARLCPPKPNGDDGNAPV